MALVSASNVVALKSTFKFGTTTNGRAYQFKQWAPTGGSSVWGRSIRLQYRSKRSSTSPERLDSDDISFVYLAELKSPAGWLAAAWWLATASPLIFLGTKLQTKHADYRVHSSNSIFLQLRM
ncbi:hypothetical protein ACFX13_039161 [Malus domestica]